MSPLKTRLIRFVYDHFLPYMVNRRWQATYGYKIDWNKPRDINEKMQWLNCFSDTKLWSLCADKYRVREFLEERGLGHLAVRLYGVWQNANDIDFDNLPETFVLKCNHDSGIPCFSALRIYTYSKLLYEPHLDYNYLVDDFSRHYYGEAADEFLEYFYFIRALYNEKNVSGSIWASLETKEIWSLPTLEYMMSIYDRAFASIEPLRESNPQRFSLLNDRLRRERITPIFLLFRLYMSFLTQEQKEEYIDDFAFYTNKYEIIQTGEAENNLEGIIQEWKSSIYGN